MTSDQLTAIFTRLRLTYGKRFSDQYAGQPAGEQREHWAGELGHLSEREVQHGLDHLPADHPPNVLQFRELCRQAPRPAVMRSQVPSVRGSTPMPERVAEALKRLQERPPVHPLDGARKLRAREQAGEHLTLAQRDYWRRALKEREHGTE